MYKTYRINSGAHLFCLLFGKKDETPCHERQKENQKSKFQRYANMQTHYLMTSDI